MAVQQSAQEGTLEEILRCLGALAQSPAFALEMQIVAERMGSQAPQTGPFLDANGGTFTISMQDTTFGDPTTWVPMSWAQVFTNEQQLRPVPPYPLLEVFGGPGRPGLELDTGEDVWWYGVDLVTAAQADYPQAASRMAFALALGMERLIRRNPSLGGLVHRIYPESPPTPGGEVETAHVGILAGVIQRYSVGAFAGTD